MTVGETAKASQAAARAFARDEPRLQRLHGIIDRESLLRGDFVLSSGRRSTYLFQLRQATMHPEGAWLIGSLIVDFMRTKGLRCIGGLELGAVPIVAAVAAVSFHLQHPVQAFFVRKTAKQHGARERIDGYVAEGSEVLVIDDVTTTGGSTLEAVKALADKRCEVRTALSIVDREEGATALLAANGITLHSLLRRSDFVIS